MNHLIDIDELAIDPTFEGDEDGAATAGKDQLEHSIEDEMQNVDFLNSLPRNNGKKSVSFSSQKNLIISEDEEEIGPDYSEQPSRLLKQNSPSPRANKKTDRKRIDPKKVSINIQMETIEKAENFEYVLIWLEEVSRKEGDKGKKKKKKKKNLAGNKGIIQICQNIFDLRAVSSRESRYLRKWGSF